MRRSLLDGAMASSRFQESLECGEIASHPGGIAVEYFRAHLRLPEQGEGDFGSRSIGHDSHRNEDLGARGGYDPLVDDAELIGRCEPDPHGAFRALRPPRLAHPFVIRSQARGPARKIPWLGGKLV